MVNQVLVQHQTTVLYPLRTVGGLNFLCIQLGNTESVLEDQIQVGTSPAYYCGRR